MRSLLSFSPVLIPLLLSGCALLSPAGQRVSGPSTAAGSPAAQPSSQPLPQAAPSSESAQPDSAAAQPAAANASATKPDANANAHASALANAQALMLASYSERVRNLGAPELTAELARLGNSNAPQEQLQLAVALAQLHQMPELIRAQDIVAKVLGHTSDEAKALHPLARLLAVRLGEQRRLEDLLDKQNQQVKDLQKRLDQTTERLEALKAIERSLVIRPAAVLPSAAIPVPSGGNRGRSGSVSPLSLPLSIPAAPARSATPQP